MRTLTESHYLQTNILTFRLPTIPIFLPPDICFDIGFFFSMLPSSHALTTLSSASPTTIDMQSTANTALQVDCVCSPATS